MSVANSNKILFGKKLVLLNFFRGNSWCSPGFFSWCLTLSLWSWDACNAVQMLIAPVWVMWMHLIGSLDQHKSASMQWWSPFCYLKTKCWGNYLIAYVLHRLNYVNFILNWPISSSICNLSVWSLHSEKANLRKKSVGCLKVQQYEVFVLVEQLVHMSHWWANLLLIWSGFVEK